jgi:6-pyruvoyltetrahydropterin/6-carboxytetrahydropterin synthase
MKACREFYFDSAHFLPYYRGTCERLHGHTYKLEVVVKGDIGKDGMVMDFSNLKEIVNSHIIERLDHMNLNDILDVPTAENIATWIFDELDSKMGEMGDAGETGGISLHSVKLWEGHGKWVEVCREDRQ